ncbi:uncharacterized protein [Takifugu rubripes]|uniref:uncharacterized protein n=1 Tax=Takifugu rubripes TaxID=31033 RepID=UPI0011457EC8|nr:uncharacterized protein LOC115251677 [Takifugu rubripes]
MGSNKSKQTNEMTPVKVIIATHPANKRRIQQCMRNWHKMTSGRNQWPLEGSFDPGRCDEVEEELRNKDKKHEVTHMGKKLGNVEQRDILQYFRMEATRNPIMHKDTDYRPPSYYPGRAGQFIMIDEDKVEGKITGKIKVKINEDEEEAREQPSSSQKDACTSTSQSHLSEGTPRKATHKSENGGIRESEKIKERARKEEEQLKELIRHNAELESVTSQQNTTEDQEGKDKPESSSDEGNDDLEEDDGEADLSSEDSVVLWQSPVRKRSKFSAATLTKAKSGQTFDLQLQMEKRETGGGMTLRQRMEKKDQSRGTASAKMCPKMCPLVAKGAQNDYRYVPWSFMDMITLAGKLTPLAEGADKWIEKLEEITGGINLAGGDIKALLIKTAGQTATAEIFRAAGYRGMTVTHQHDEVSFDQMRTGVWKALREKYPSRMDPTKLEKESLKEEDGPTQFLHSYQKMWKTETGSEWDSTETTKALFMMYIKNAMPKEVQDKLNGVVGLMKMTWPVFSEHIIHYVNAYRAEKQALEDQNKILANKLTQLQIGELAKQKKDREKPRPQAAVRAADPEPEKGPTVERVAQAPKVTPVMSPPPASQATPAVPQALSAVAPAGQLQTQQMPPIHMHLNQGGGIQRPAAGGGRGGPPVRGRWRRPQGPRRSRGPPPGRAPPQYRAELQCWGCGQIGHLQRECPVSPWTGPQNPGTVPAVPANGLWMGPAAYWQWGCPEKPEGKGIMPILTQRPHAEPTINVTVYNHRHQFMIDTGATYSCIGKDGANLPLSASKIRTVGFSGKTQVMPMTGPVPLQIGKRTIYTSLLYSADAPINLLGGDVLCQLQAEIKCTPDGIYFDVAEEQPDRVSVPMTSLTTPTDSPRTMHLGTEARVFWMKLTTSNSFLYHEWETWRPLVMNHYDTSKEPTLPLHCTMMYDENQTHEDYEQSWDEAINNKATVIQYEDIIIGPQGVAAVVKLQDDVKDWFQVPNSTPHVTLLIADKYESHDLGPMVKAARQVKDWMTTDCQQIRTSPDGLFFKIAFTLADEAMAEKVKVPRERVRQMLIAEEHTTLLEQVPSQVWSQHKTDVGFVKSAEPQKFLTKPGVRLPHQRQYPLRPDTIEGIRSTITGLEDAGVLIKTRSACNTPIFPIKKPNSDEYRLVHDLRAINAIVTEEIPIVPDPHTLLFNIPPGTKWFTVIDLCSAFFSVPVHPDSQYLFAFTYKNQQYTYTRLPQGFVHSTSIFNRILANDLSHLNIQSTTLMYVDNILICSESKEQCEKDSITVLTALAEGGHKVWRATADLGFMTTLLKQPHYEL